MDLNYFFISFGMIFMVNAVLNTFKVRNPMKFFIMGFVIFTVVYFGGGITGVSDGVNEVIDGVEDISGWEIVVGNSTEKKLVPFPEDGIDRYEDGTAKCRFFTETGSFAYLDAIYGDESFCEIKEDGNSWMVICQDGSIQNEFDCEETIKW